jgi:hypothetical protein
LVWRCEILYVFINPLLGLPSLFLLSLMSIWCAFDLAEHTAHKFLIGTTVILLVILVRAALDYRPRA